MRIDNIDLWKSVKRFDHKLTFDDHISGLCMKASRIIFVLARVTLYMNK